ncbi:unnamed protein product [Nezara viridula]|uniref:Uncharacterized protein n=1 Tax=Nezara viridula TaxID=85310 RepID=A0A9P0E4P6_NEZVI|nr:unnamed protein product [Nezara viridula]
MPSKCSNTGCAMKKKLLMISQAEDYRILCWHSKKKYGIRLIKNDLYKFEILER